MPSVLLWVATTWCHWPSLTALGVVIVLVKPVQTPKVSVPSLFR